MRVGANLHIACRSLRWPYTRCPILSLSAQRINSTIPGYRFLSQACTVKIVHRLPVHVSVVHSTLGITNIYFWGAHPVKLINYIISTKYFVHGLRGPYAFEMHCPLVFKLFFCLCSRRKVQCLCVHTNEMYLRVLCVRVCAHACIEQISHA